MMSVQMPQPLSCVSCKADMMKIDENVTYEQFILFGDSITQIDGNPALSFSCYQALQYDYMRRIDIVNRGFSGYNTSNALTILPQIFPSPKQASVRLVTLFFGANDASLPNTTGTHIPLSDYTTNIRHLISHPIIRAHTAVRVLLITPPPIDEWQFDAWDEPGKSARKANVARTYAGAVRDLGMQMGIAVADLWSACMAEVDWNDKKGDTKLPGDRAVEKSEGLARLLYDGLHLSGEGYKLLYRVMTKAITDTYPELQPQRLPVVLEPFYPEWYKL